MGASSFTYDSVGRLTNLQHYNGAGSVLANYTYAYDKAGRLTTQTDNGGTPITYTYDAANQLTADSSNTHTYDANGNRTDTGYVTSTGNEVTNAPSWTYTYDAEGNLSSKTNGSVTWTYAYDDANRMISAQETGTATENVTYTYDTSDNLLSESATGAVAGTTHYGYDGSNAWADLSSSNALVTRRLFDNSDNTPLARESAGGTVAWYEGDHEGSVRLVTDGVTGAAIDTMTYDGYGKQTGQSSPANGDAYAYIGCRIDAPTGLLNSTARYLDLGTFRFTSQDPLGFSAGDLNLYRPDGNDPTGYTDPSGLERIKVGEIGRNWEWH